MRLLVLLKHVITIYLIFSLLLIASNYVTFYYNSTVEANFTPEQFAGLMNTTKVYNTDLEIENITANTSISLYSYRSSGSKGANAVREYIVNKFEAYGLNVTEESFDFWTWELYSKPYLILDVDNNFSTLEDQYNLTFYASHYTLPLRDDQSYEVYVVTLPKQYEDIPPEFWDNLNLTNKIVFIGFEVLRYKDWRTSFLVRVSSSSPKAIIFMWAFNEHEGWPPYFRSIGGKYPTLFWTKNITIGWIDWQSQKILYGILEEGNSRIYAKLFVNSSIFTSEHTNIIGKLEGESHEKYFIISAHYDSVVTNAFCDNGMGVSLMLHLAEKLAELRHKENLKLPYDVYFIAFAAEELGLVGSEFYLMNHLDDDILSVINLDSIGSETLFIADSIEDQLTDFVEEILEENDIQYITARAYSDHVPFDDPLSAQELTLYLWGGTLDESVLERLNDANSVPALTIASYPLTLFEGNGYIHTKYDNSTSTSTLGWMNFENLNAQVRAIALVVFSLLTTRNNSTDFSSLFFLAVIIVIIIGVGLVVLTYFWRKRKGNMQKSI